MTVYKYIDGMINIMLMIFNFFSRCSLFFRPKLRKLIKNNRKLKELRKSEECFIMGNGPSLKNVDFKKLENKETFAVNYFYKYREDGFESKYFVAIDDIFANSEGIEYIEKLYHDKKMYIILRHSCFFNSKEKFDLNRCFFLYAKQFQAGNDVRIECDKNMTACINVVLQCIQIALDMGYKKIYLLGCEFSEYAQLKVEHFYNVDLTRAFSMGDEARWAALVHYHHYALERYAKKRGVEIINLTPGSLIDAYKKDSFENII